MWTIDGKLECLAVYFFNCPIFDSTSFIEVKVVESKFGEFLGLFILEHGSRMEEKFYGAMMSVTSFEKIGNHHPDSCRIHMPAETDAAEIGRGYSHLLQHMKP